MRKCISAALIVLMTAGSIGFAQMQCPMMGGDGKGMGMRGHGGMMMGGGIGRILALGQDLKLTDDQVSKLQKMRADAMKDAVKRQADIKALRIDLLSSLNSPTPDFNAAQSTTKKISDLQAQAKIAMLSSFQNAYNVLTKDQQTVLYKTMQNRMMQHDPDEDEE